MYMLVIMCTCYQVRDGEKGEVLINTTMYCLQPLQSCQHKLAQFIAYSEMMFEHTAPVTTLQAWVDGSAISAGKLKAMQAPGIESDGYHHT